MQLYNPYNNINLWIKHTFLSFAQGYFSLDSRYTWNINPQLTKLIIADKFAVDLGVIDKKPAIILSRGGFGWTDSFRGQDGRNSVLSSKRVDTLAPAPTGDRWADFVLTDLIRGSVTYNVLSKNGIEAEEIANKLFVALSGYKNELKAFGIHKTMGLSIGDERIIKTNSEIEAMGVTVSLGFMAQRTIEKADSYRTIVDPVAAVMQVPKETTTGIVVQDVKLYENIDYRILNDGVTVEFLNPPPADTVSINLNFVDSVTLNAVTTELSGVIDGENTTYYVPSGTVYGYYILSDSIIVSGIATASGVNEPPSDFISMSDY
jgi:hypothetical protein